MTKIDIAGFGESIKKKRKNNIKRKPPQIRKEIRNLKYGKHGTPLTISNFFALKIEIDGIEIRENDFKKLFPSVYEKFNIELSEKYKTVDGNLKIENKAYFYFPNEILKNHKIKVIYRDQKDKMKQVIYDLTIDKVELEKDLKTEEKKHIV